MKTIVVDASAVLSVLLHEAHRAAILAATAGCELVSPDSLPFEVANALSARMKRGDAQRLEAQEASEAFRQFASMTIRLVPQSMADHARALALAGRLGIYAYDAYMLVCSQAAKAALLTLDGRGRRPGLVQQAEALGIELVPLED